MRLDTELSVFCQTVVVAISTCELFSLIFVSLQRVRLIAAAKNIPTEEINIHLKVKPDWFVPKINPYGKVPVIEHEGKLIRESLIAFGKYLLVIRDAQDEHWPWVYAIEICIVVFCWICLV